MLIRAILATIFLLHVNSANADLRKCFSNEEMNSIVKIENRNKLHNLVNFVLFTSFSADSGPVEQEYIPYLLYSLFLHINKPNDKNSRDTIDVLEGIKNYNDPKPLFVDGGEKDLKDAITCVSDKTEDCASIFFKSGSLMSLNQLSNIPEFEYFFSEISSVCLDSLKERT
jgi:hypothetical protein